MVSKCNIKALRAYTFLSVVFSNSLDINMKAHKLSETLLAQKPLSLQVALLNVLCWKNTRPIQAY